jgi:hypothetical protein
VAIKPSSVVALYRYAVPGLRQPVRIEVEISLRERVLRRPVTVSTARIAHPSGIEPVVTVQRSAGKLYVILADPPPAEGERDLEVHPERPAGEVPELVDRGSRSRPQPEPIEVPGGLAVAAPAAVPAAAAVAPVAAGTVLPQSPVVVRAAPPQPLQLPRASGTRSFALFTFQQVEAAEHIPGKSLSGFPTGPAGLEVQHWLWGFLGVGGEARYLSWAGKGEKPMARQDALVILRAGARLPLPYFEPELYVAGAQRYEVAPTHSGIDPPTLALGGGFRLQPAEAVGLRIWGQLFPFGIGMDKVWRAGASFLVDAGPVLLSIGYTHDDKAVLGGTAAYEAAVVGAGVQW